MHFAIPTDPNQALLVPPIGELVSAATANRRRLGAAQAEIGGVRLAALRAGLRRHVLELTRCDPEDDRPIIATGHQPGMPHPGTLFKQAVLEQVTPQAVAINVVVESDTARLIAARVPARRSGAVVVESIPLAQAERGVVTGRAPKPERRDLDEGLSRARRAAATLRSDKILEAVDRFAAIHREEYARHDSLAELLTAYRARYFPTPHVRDIFLAALCDTEEYRTFAAALLADAARFLDVHNQALAHHRRERRIRTRVNPFPDLRNDGAAVEAPFWHIGEDGHRAPVFVEAGRSRTTLRALATPLGVFSTHAQLLRLLAGVALRPRAATLTMFLRLCVSDFFVHGVGGGNYDAVTDAIIRDYCGVEPPAYGVASLSLRLPLAFDGDLETQVPRLAYRARRMTWNPNEFVGAAHPLRREKTQILAGAGEHLTRADHERIEAIRRRLLDEIAAERRANADELDAARRALETQQRLAARDFPYFLYPLPVLEAGMRLVKPARQGSK